jgi:hypothetical protein
MKKQATAKARTTTKTNTGILRCAQNDDLKTTATADPLLGSVTATAIVVLVR